MRIASYLIPLFIVTASTIARAQLTPTYNDQVIGTVPRDDGAGSVTLMIDIYKPTGVTTPTPTVLWIHGGGWQAGTYNNVPAFLGPLLQQGISIASARYRLSGEAIFPAQVHDVKGAVRFLRANSQTYGLDPLRIGSWGSSAGGHLSALLATSGGVSAAEGTSGGNLAQSSRILAAVDYFGPTDILNMNLDVTNPPGSSINHDAPTSPESRLIGFAGPGEGIGVLRANQDNPSPPFPQKMALVNLANPIRHVDAGDPVLFIAHGTGDTLVPLRQSTKLHDALTLDGVPHEYREVIGAGHGNLGSTTDAAAGAFLIAELTRPFGDANRDGLVNLSDFNILAANFGQSGGWRQGDFNSDGMIDLGDFNLLAANFGTGSLAAVPEPAVGIAGLCLLPLLLRSRVNRCVARACGDARCASATPCHRRAGPRAA
jgi:acetyl esterase/lipase